jgi:hypothetical protein
VINIVLTGISPSTHYNEVFDLLHQAAKPLVDHQKEFETLDDLSHSLDKVLLGGPPRVMNAGALMTQLWSGMAETLWEKWLQYTDSDPDVSKSIVALEFHSTMRRTPVNLFFSLGVPFSFSS